ncbi:hypothetical protein V8C34DRAFT_173317 [Trichoderma compactum]
MAKGGLGMKRVCGMREVFLVCELGSRDDASLRCRRLVLRVIDSFLLFLVVWGELATVWMGYECKTGWDGAARERKGKRVFFLDFGLWSLVFWLSPCIVGEICCFFPFSFL